VNEKQRTVHFFNREVSRLMACGKSVLQCRASTVYLENVTCSDCVAAVAQQYAPLLIARAKAALDAWDNWQPTDSHRQAIAWALNSERLARDE
jgi:hypothetical protein